MIKLKNIWDDLTNGSARAKALLISIPHRAVLHCSPALISNCHVVNMQSRSIVLGHLSSRHLLLREAPDVLIPWWAEVPTLQRSSHAETTASMSAKLLLKTMAGTVSGLHFLESVGQDILPNDLSPRKTPLSRQSRSPNSSNKGTRLTYVDVMHRTLNKRVRAGCDLSPEVAESAKELVCNLSRAITGIHAAAHLALEAASAKFGAFDRCCQCLARMWF